MIGNFIADHIKGNQFKHYHEEIQKGIFLHREIDTFTDAHEIVRKSKRRLHERYRHYDGVIIDIFYDHFLAKNFSSYSNESLADFAANFYTLLDDNFHLLTPRFKMILPTLKSENWLLMYATVPGITHILYNMDRRTRLQSKMQFSVQELALYYTEFEVEFTQFFAEMEAFVKEKMNEWD